MFGYFLKKMRRNIFHPYIFLFKMYIRPGGVVYVHTYVEVIVSADGANDRGFESCQGICKVFRTLYITMVLLEG
jgi:hypothetical protein